MQPVTIITGALLSQVLLGIIMFVGATVLHVYENRPGSRFDTSLLGLNGFILLMLLGSVALLLSTASLSQIWIGLFKGTTFVGIEDSRAMLAVFLINIIVTALLIFFTGGSINSPFQPIFFLIPTLALLLYESTFRVVLYSSLVTFGFLALTVAGEGLHWSQLQGARKSYTFVSVACLALAVLIGVLTRTCPTGTC